MSTEPEVSEDTHDQPVTNRRRLFSLLTPSIGDRGRARVRLLRQLLVKNNAPRKQDAPPPPAPISPQLVQRDAKAAASQSQSAFFSRLPPETREQILREAFGDRTMHIELELDHVLEKRPRSGEERSLFPDRFTYARQLAKPRQWAWRSSTCCCNASHAPPGHLWWHEHWHEPEVNTDALDNHDESQFCEKWLDRWPVRGRVGAIGWLLACQRSYAEGADILYRTNTFHIGGQQLLKNLHDHMVGENLARISSIEVALPLISTHHETDLQPKCPLLRPFLETLDQLPGLKRLHLNLPCPRFWEPVGSLFMGNIINALDKFVRQSSIALVVVQLEPSALYTLAADAISFGIGESSEGADAGPIYNLWRCLDSDDPEGARTERVEWPPSIPPSTKPGMSVERRRGYWLTQFSEEMNFAYNIGI